MSKWYLLGGQWIICGFPQNISMYQKPVYGYKINNSSDGQETDILRLKIINFTEEENSNII